MCDSTQSLKDNIMKKAPETGAFFMINAALHQVHLH